MQCRTLFLALIFAASFPAFGEEVTFVVAYYPDVEDQWDSATRMSYPAIYVRTGLTQVWNDPDTGDTIKMPAFKFGENSQFPGLFSGGYTRAQLDTFLTALQAYSVDFIWNDTTTISTASSGYTTIYGTMGIHYEYTYKITIPDGGGPPDDPPDDDPDDDDDDDDDDDERQGGAHRFVPVDQRQP